MTDKVPREITQKAYMHELWFLHSACRLILVDICMQIHEDLSYRANTIKTRFGDGQSSNGNYSKSINERVMVLGLCTPSNAG